MILTERFVACVAAGALMIGLSGWLEPLMAAGIALVALSVVLALADWLRLARGVSLEIGRECEDKLSLGAQNHVRIALRNRGHVTLNGAVRDEYPEGFEARGNVVDLRMPARSTAEAVYQVTPPKRGDFEFGDIYVRLRGPLGMAARQIRYPMRRAVKVYPNLLEMRRYQTGLRRERPVRPGQKVARIRGRGTDFESLRDYLPDDEFRAVDWKATARRGKLVTRLYQEEKSQNVMIVLDCGRVMGPVIAGLSRLDHSVNAAMMLAHVAALKGDRVGLMAFGEEIASYLPPRAGKSQTLNLLGLAYNLHEAQGDSDYHRAVHYLSRRWSRRSLVVFFTDLVDPESSAPLISQVASLTRKHLCVCATMADPAVLAMARGPVETSEDAFRAAGARQVLHARRQAAARLVRSGATVIDLPPDELTRGVVSEYLNIKVRGLL